MSHGVNEQKLKQKILELEQEVKRLEQVEKSFKIKEARYYDIIRNLSDFVFIHDTEGNVLESNLNSMTGMGYAETDLDGLNMVDLLPDRIRPKFNDYLKNVIQKGKHTGITKFRKKNGDERYIEYRNILLNDELKKPESIIGSFTDISGRMETEKINRTLMDIANAVNTAFDLGDLYQSIHRSLSRIIDTTNFHISLYDPEEDSLSFPYHVDEKDDLKKFTRNLKIPNASQSNLLSLEVIKTGKPFFIKRKEYDERLKKDSKRGLGFPSEQWLGVPLKMENKIFGAMVVQSYSDPDKYNQKDADILLAVSDQVANAIYRKQTEEIIKANEKKIKNLSRQTEQFSLAAASMITTRDEKTFFNIISNAIIRYSDFNKVVISYFKDESAQREIIGYGGLSNEEIKKLKGISLPKTEYAGWLAQCHKIGPYSYYLPHTKMNVIDPAFAIRSRDNIPDSVDGWHPHDMLFVRMNDEQGDLIGGISVDDSKTGRLPTAETVRPLEIFSSLISQIIINKKREQVKKMTEAKYRTILENIEDGYYEVDMDGDFSFVSKVTCRIFEMNREDLLGINFRKFVNETEAEKIYRFYNRTFKSGKTRKGYTTAIRVKNGAKKDIEITITPIMDDKNHTTGFRGIVRDVTERIRTEKKLRKYHDHLEELVNERTSQLTELNQRLQQSQKMESIGTLAGGIAHDFNNILSSIIGYTELAVDDTLPGSLLQKNLREVLIAGNRAKELVHQILTFSRQTNQELKPVKMKSIVKEALNMIRATLPTTISVEQEIASNSLVMADPIHVHQVLVNLCTNAAHSMKKDGGVLRVVLRDTDARSGLSEHFVGITPGTYIRLSVADTGHGIPPQIMDRIFDPFFTTKKQNEGTGMGLSVVHGIVKGLKGIIIPASDPDKGTVFEVYLPVLDPGIKANEEMKKQSPSGNETILFVDDEPALLNMSQQMLSRLGYNVEVRSSSIEALELFKTHPDKFDMVITDMIMPHMTGGRLAKEILGIRPNLPMILCTGFSEDINNEKARAFGFKAFVTKPILKQEIAETIRKALDD